MTDAMTLALALANCCLFGLVVPGCGQQFWLTWLLLARCNKRVA